MNQIDSKLVHLQRRLGQSPEATQYVQEIKDHTLNLLRTLRLQGYNQEESMRKVLLAIEDERGYVVAYYRKHRRSLPAWKIGIGIIGFILITLQLFLVGIGGIWLNLSFGPITTTSNTWFVLFFYLSCLALLTPIAVFIQGKYAGCSIIYGCLVMYLYTLMYISPFELFLCNALYLLLILRRSEEVYAVCTSIFIQITYIFLFIGVNEVNMSLRTKMGLYELVNFKFFFVLHFIVIILPSVTAILMNWITHNIVKRAQ